ncbi:hypothetical protein H2201_000381 [Coniosporium apollinis]|uniref:Major facilitator superfamily (MFS) profile domain-containing protein n=1 Tax=Coniosporium apollinis TaxID=61459 RepID=A0ABQ9P7G3_9PEZI|nr:hypothetical protein H2201_000381 [Coniosporium apollinis]
MAARGLGALFEIEQGAKMVVHPPRALQSTSTQPPAPSVIELGEYTWGSRYNGPSNTGTQTPITPNELEMSQPPTPKRAEAAGLVQSFSNPAMNRWRVLAACLVYFGNGLNDAATGAIIPYMEKEYHIGHAIVSLIFVTTAAGFILAAPFIDALDGRIGRAKTFITAEMLIIIGFVMIACTPPYAVVAIAFFLNGYGAATTLALNNVFLANLAGATVLLGAGHGCYGIGGIVGPIMATAMISAGMSWSRFYLVALGIRVVSLVLTAWAFWNYEKEASTQLLTALERTASQRAAIEDGAPTKKQLLKRALRNRVTIMGALLIFAYQGAEVAISGWVISFLIDYRDGDPAQVGFVTAGFWGGITLGRFVLTHVAHLVGEKRFVYGLGLGAIVFQLLVWLVPNVIGNAVAVSIVGLLLGPIYPCAQTIFVKLLPHNIQTTSIGFISSAGSSGGAVVPFTTGLLAQAVGTYVLHPVAIAFFVIMLACCFGLPNVRKREE